MNRRVRLRWVIGGVALIGAFLAWLVLRANVMELIGLTGDLGVGLALHLVAWLLLIGGVSLTAAGTTVSSGRSSSRRRIKDLR